MPKRKRPHNFNPDVKTPKRKKRKKRKKTARQLEKKYQQKEFKDKVYYALLKEIRNISPTDIIKGDALKLVKENKISIRWNMQLGSLNILESHKHNKRPGLKTAKQAWDNLRKNYPKIEKKLNENLEIRRTNGKKKAKTPLQNSKKNNSAKNILNFFSRSPVKTDKKQRPGFKTNQSLQNLTPFQMYQPIKYIKQPSRRQILLQLKLADAWRQKGELDRAHTCYEDLTKSNPESYKAWYYLGNSHSEDGQYSKAMICYKKVLELCLRTNQNDLEYGNYYQLAQHNINNIDQQQSKYQPIKYT